MMKRSTQGVARAPTGALRALVLGLALVACREVRGEPDALHDEERDAARGADGANPLDASADAERMLDADVPIDAHVLAPADAASDARAHDASPPSSDGSPQSAVDATMHSDAQSGPYKWYDSALPPSEGAWPVDAQVGSVPIDAGNDPGCVLSALGNAQGVGASCWHETRDQTCFSTRTCSEALALRGLAMPAPYYCTRPCRQHSDCGDKASCCSVPGLEGNACILDGCRYSCR
jgi:hypothetical protein